MAYEKIASDLAATFYAASLLPDPTLESKPRLKALDVYRAKGQEIAATLLNPRRSAVIRCPSGTRSAHPDQPSHAIATVHDRSLVVVRGPRRSNYAPPTNDEGLRLIDHFLIDLGIARRDGFEAISVWCYGCGALHELGLGWLKRARLNQHSTPSEHYQLAPSGDPIRRRGTHHDIPTTPTGSPSQPPQARSTAPK